MGQRAVRRGKPPNDAVDGRPAFAGAAVFARHTQGQQAALAQQGALGQGGAAALVALHRGGREPGGEGFDGGAV